MMSENEKHKHIHQEKQSGVISEGRDGREKLLDASEISLVLDTYDDIFSDFDPRPYDHRSLSQDFLAEAKHAARDKISGLELKFLIPKALQDAGKEGLIELRLREHFEKHAHMIRQEITSGRLRGIVLVIIGMLITVAAAALGYFFKQNVAAEIAVVVLEPAGWFTIWNGLDMSVFATRGKGVDLSFYEKMQDAEITFEAY